MGGTAWPSLRQPGAAAPATAGEPPLWGIAEMARHYRVTPRTLRHYEAEGLLRPVRSGHQRLYTRADRARLAWILRGRSVGFGLAEIRELLDLYDPARPEPQLQATVARCRVRLSELHARRADLEATIAEIEDFVAGLEARRAAPSFDSAGARPVVLSPAQKR